MSDGEFPNLNREDSNSGSTAVYHPMGALGHIFSLYIRRLREGDIFSLYIRRLREGGGIEVSAKI